MIRPGEGYFTCELPRTVHSFTNEWNRLDGCDWSSQTRGAFASEREACEWARDHLPRGAPFLVCYIAPDE